MASSLVVFPVVNIFMLFVFLDSLFSFLLHHVQCIKPSLNTNQNFLVIIVNLLIIVKCTDLEVEICKC